MACHGSCFHHSDAKLHKKTITDIKRSRIVGVYITTLHISRLFDIFLVQVTLKKSSSHLYSRYIKTLDLYNTPTRRIPSPYFQLYLGCGVPFSALNLKPRRIMTGMWSSVPFLNTFSSLVKADREIQRLFLSDAFNWTFLRVTENAVSFCFLLSGSEMSSTDRLSHEPLRRFCFLFCL